MAGWALGRWQDTEGVVTCLDEMRHGLEDGDHVTFAEVKGMDDLNSCAPRPVKVLGAICYAGCGACSGSVGGLIVRWSVCSVLV